MQKCVIKHDVDDSQNTTEYLFAKCWCTRWQQLHVSALSSGHHQVVYS